MKQFLKLSVFAIMFAATQPVFANSAEDEMAADLEYYNEKLAGSDSCQAQLITVAPDVDELHIDNQLVLTIDRPAGVMRSELIEGEISLDRDDFPEIIEAYIDFHLQKSGLPVIKKIGNWLCS